MPEPAPSPSIPLPARPVRRFGMVAGHRRALLLDARYQLRVAATVAGLVAVGVGVLGAAIALETLHIQRAAASLDANLARVLEPGVPTVLLLLGALGVALVVAAFGVVVLERHRTASAALGIRRALARLREGAWGEPMTPRATDHLREVVDEVNALSLSLRERADRLLALAEQLEADASGSPAVARELRALASGPAPDAS